MKLAQFRAEGSGNPSLGILIDDRLFAVPALAQAVKGSGGEVADWLLEAVDMRAVIARGLWGLPSSSR